MKLGFLIASDVGVLLLLLADDILDREQRTFRRFGDTRLGQRMVDGDISQNARSSKLPAAIRTKGFLLLIVSKTFRLVLRITAKPRDPSANRTGAGIVASCDEATRAAEVVPRIRLKVGVTLTASIGHVINW